MSNEFDQELLSDEEVEGFKATPPIESDEPEPTPEEPKVEKEPSPPEPEKKVEAEPAPKVEPEPAPVVEKPPEKPTTIDGIIAKDGKNYIPFSVLEEERAAKKQAIEDRQRLEAEVAELKKPKEPVKEPVREPERKVEAPPPIDFKAIAHTAYESEEGMATALQQMFEAGKQVAIEAGTTAGKATTIETEFTREAMKLKGDNPWITPGFVEDSIYNGALRIMAERKVSTDDLPGMVQAAKDAVAEGKKMFRVDEPKIDLKSEVEKAAKIAYEKAVKDVMAKFNIKETEPQTLSDVRNVNPDVLNKFDELDKLTGIDFEEAYGQLKPEEREAFLRRGEA
jgi:hypothetical protein